MAEKLNVETSACDDGMRPHISHVAELDESQEAVRNVDKLTDSEPVKGEDLLGSEELKRQLREAKERLKSESTDKPRK